MQPLLAVWLQFAALVALIDAHVSPLQGVSALSAIMMSGIAIVGLLYRPQKRLFRTVGWTSLFLFLPYLLNSYVLFRHEG